MYVIVVGSGKVGLNLARELIDKGKTESQSTVFPGLFDGGGIGDYVVRS